MIETGPIKTETESRNSNAQITGTFPLSFSQESLWLEHQVSPGGAYNMPEAWRLKGLLDILVLRKSLDALVQRHETLRTVIRRGADGGPCQVIFDTSRFPLEMVDACGIPTCAEPETLREMMTEQAQKPFDLENGPLARGTLYRLSEQDHVLLINMHHIISDAWSQAVFMRDLSAFYCHFASRKDLNLDELAIQFADFVVWQRENAAGEAHQKQLEFWTDKLKGSLPASNPPEDFQRTALSSRPGVTTFSRLEADLVKKLEDLSRKHHVTLFMTLLAGFKALLHRYTGNEDIVVGCPMSGRDRTEAEPLIGMFVNTLAFRTEMHDDPTFAELLGRVRESSLDAYANQDIGLDQLVNRLKPERIPHRHPIFQVVFGLQTEPPKALEFPGLEVERIESGNGSAKFDWTLLLTRDKAELLVRSEIDTSLYKRQTSERFVRHFRSLLAAAAEQPERRLSELEWTTDEEQRLTVLEWNRTDAKYEREGTVQSVFEEHAKHQPARPALTFNGAHTSYDALNRRANRIAGVLLDHGVGPGARVAIRVKRSPDLIAAMLGTLKAGAAFVPLDDSYPENRIRFMLENSGASILLGDSNPHEFERCKTILLAGIQGEAENPNVAVKADDLAYVMYTSGSTGTPKGVEVSHRAILRLVLNANYVQIDETSTFLQFSSSSFDASTFEIWGALLNGARLVVFPPHMPSLAELGRTIASEKVSVLWLTAGLFNQMIDSEPASLAGVGQLLTGGEALSVQHVRKAVQQLTACTIINGYGPTENTTFSCCYRVPARMFDGRHLPASIPIGRPISNSQAYVLNPALKPCPIGCPGELWVGGDGLAMGYAGQPELAAERFQRVNISGVGIVRLYRTGDIARWQNEGTIEFLGRRDHQVKLRGFRIETGEIEAALQQIPGIDAAVVTVLGEGANKRLVAYLAVKDGAPLTKIQILNLLSAQLPAYMIPSDVVLMEQFPLTRNGKVDRSCLPEPEFESAGHETVEPRSEQERIIRKVWQEVLKRNGFGVHDNFFHLGGHSLLATQAASRLSQVFGTEVPVSFLFEHPTIALLAKVLPKEPSQEPREEPLLAEADMRNRARDLLEKLDTLTDEEVEALLKEGDGVRTRR